MRGAGETRTTTAWSVAKDFARGVRVDQVDNGAAALAFYALLSLFPAAIFSLSVLPYLPIPGLRETIDEWLHMVLPDDSASLFTNTVDSVVSERHSGLLSFGFVLAIWSGSQGLYAAMQQLNIVYEVSEQRPFWRTRSLSLLLLLALFGVMVWSFGLITFGDMLEDWIASRLGWSVALRTVFAALRWLVALSASWVAFAWVYWAAPEALDTLEDHMPVYPWISDAAVVSRSKLGTIRIHSTWAQDDTAVGAGTGLGAVTGGLLGLLLGPGGALAGAAVGGSMGAVFGVGDEITFDDPRLDDFAASLAKDTSALILVGEKPTLADFASAVQPFGGKVIETNLNEDDITALKKAGH
jgi:YihY family inner membrane protein